MEVNIIFMTKNYNKCDSESVPLIMDWLGHEGLHFMQTLTDDKQNLNPHLMNLYYHYTITN